MQPLEIDFLKKKNSPSQVLCMLLMLLSLFVSTTVFRDERMQLGRIFLAVAFAFCLPPLVYSVKYISKSMKGIS